jgi:hypothetical protein
MSDIEDIEHIYSEFFVKNDKYFVKIKNIDYEISKTEYDKFAWFQIIPISNDEIDDDIDDDVDDWLEVDDVDWFGSHNIDGGGS